jgi:hypothetical protein
MFLPQGVKRFPRVFRFALDNVLRGCIQFGENILQQHIFFISFHAHDHHIAVTVFCNEDRLPGAMAELRDFTCVFQIFDRNNPWHCFNSSRWPYYTIIIIFLQQLFYLSPYDFDSDINRRLAAGEIMGA